ncbi:bifunctional tRNA (1-methyladenosine) methyltransferase catalytic subunit Gcd14/S-adenosyl-L-methionine-dependent methyltransferase superfamily [Babesia duncani]|uniref:tRNA (adenine(58)-N(1))-methyltransferase n=1 Tax=Babesia duncani TaxID=323732 RepID=A0AAD9PIU9_9APIC|nr:bifunctional tRNA (1-methyladenosine) methyltransferase catalytic subunit Gcd14/S-adenosyl-L-methionine-dependent methyltransferase superfamily [Babesia duncani]
MIIEKMKINGNDYAVVYGGPERVLACKIPHHGGKLDNKQQAANVKDNRVLHNKHGLFDIASCVGENYGHRIMSNDDMKHWVVVLPPNCELVLKAIRHRTQILYRADISLLLLLLDARPGKRIVECGTGSGALTYALASAVTSKGHVFSFDFHEQRLSLARKFFESAGLNDIITTFERDAYAPNAFIATDITQGSIDAVFLDLPSPWQALSSAEQVLGNMGKLVNFSPCMEQVQRMTMEMSIQGFTNVRTFEILLKPWGISFEDESQESVTGYQLPQLNHTGYLTVGTCIKNSGPCSP